MRVYVEEHLRKGFIVPAADAPYASPVLFAKKKDGGWRFCVDYRKLNELTSKEHCAPPLIEETQSRLAKANVFTKLDIRQAFYRMRMSPESEDLTAFKTRYGTYKYKVVPFGLTNGPSHFQAYINHVLMDLLDVCCTAYIDDILIYSDNVKDHEAHVNAVLEKLITAGLQADIDKSEFYVTETEFLDFIITTNGICMDPKKMKAIINWEKPTNIRGVQASFKAFATSTGNSSSSTVG